MKTTKARAAQVLMLGFLLPGSTVFAAPTSYVITDLGKGTDIEGMNVAGDVVGSLRNRDGNLHAFVFRDKKIIDLGTLGGPDSVAFAINSAGDVVGKSLVSLPERPTVSVEHAFIYRDGKMQDLCAQEGINLSVARGINDHGVIVGYDENFTPAALVDGKLQRVPPLTPRATFDFEVALGGSGAIVGNCTTEDGVLHNFLYSRNRTRDLGSPSTHGLNAAAINDADEVTSIVGQHAMLFYSDGRVRDLGAVKGRSGLSVLSINNREEIVGSAEKLVNDTRPIKPGVIDQGILTDNHAVLYRDGHWFDLNDELNPEDKKQYLLTSAVAINNHSQIAVMADGKDGRHGLILTPLQHNVRHSSAE